MQVLLQGTEPTGVAGVPVQIQDLVLVLVEPIEELLPGAIPIRGTEVVLPDQEEVLIVAHHEALPIIDLEVEPQDIEVPDVRQHIETRVDHQDTGVQEVVLPDTAVQVAVDQAQGVLDTEAALAVVLEARDSAGVPEAAQEDPACEALVVVPDLPEADLQEVAGVVAEGINRPNILKS